MLTRVFPALLAQKYGYLCAAQPLVAEHDDISLLVLVQRIRHGVEAAVRADR